MKTLPTEFRAGGFRFRQLARAGDVVLLEKTKGTWKGWEVVRLDHRPAVQMPTGHTTEEGEFMPASSTWGVCGWSPWTLEAAEKRFAAVVEAVAKAELASKVN